ncbi:hypothetical protein Tco_1022865 [Tanacetum coccineum]
MARGCTYKEFLNCQPLNLMGTKEAVGLARWFKKMKSVFHINNCVVECQVKYATCTLLNGAMTWTTRLQDTVKLENHLMDQKIHVFVAKQADNKRRMENNPRDDHVQQPPYKRQNVARAYTAGLILDAQAEAIKEEDVENKNLSDIDKKFKTRLDGTLRIEKMKLVTTF